MPREPWAANAASALASSLNQTATLSPVKGADRVRVVLTPADNQDSQPRALLKSRGRVLPARIVGFSKQNRPRGPQGRGYRTANSSHRPLRSYSQRTARFGLRQPGRFGKFGSAWSRRVLFCGSRIRIIRWSMSRPMRPSIPGIAGVR